jgi:type II secretory pathway component GspD/PulD (secretin)
LLHARRLILTMLLLTGMMSFTDLARSETVKPAQSKPKRLVTVAYPMADFVIPITNFTNPTAVAGAAKAETAWKISSATTTSESKSTLPTTEEMLMKLVQSTVAPRTWSGMGGPGTIEYCPLGMSLVVTQTPDIHERIADLLQAVRRLQDQEVSVEVRLISVPGDVMASLLLNGALSASKADANVPVPNDSNKKVDRPATKAIILNNAQVFHLMESVQRDIRTNVMQAPKLTLFNGQSASFSAEDVQHIVTGLDLCRQGKQTVFQAKTEAIPLGIRMSLQPVISADRSNVRIDLKVDMANMDPVVPLLPVTIPFKSDDESQPIVFTQFVQCPHINRVTCNASLPVPDGHTALLHAGLQIQETSSDPIPLLSDLPCVGPWLREITKQCGTEHLLVMVTPRIIIRAKVEEKQQAWVVGEEESSSPGDRCEELSGRKCKKAEVKELLRRYESACAAGRSEEATALAVRALALDPACFSTSKGKQGR